MKRQICVVSLSIILLYSCEEPSKHAKSHDKETHENSWVPDGTSQKTGDVLQFLDTFGIEENIIKQKTKAQFVREQRLSFKELDDTVSNDERGLFMGKKLIYKKSSIQWLDNAVTRLCIKDSEIVLNYHIHCGMSKDDFIKTFHLHQTQANTLSFATGFLTNHITFVFSNNVLSAVFMEQLFD